MTVKRQTTKRVLKSRRKCDTTKFLKGGKKASLALTKSRGGISGGKRGWYVWGEGIGRDKTSIVTVAHNRRQVKSKLPELEEGGVELRARGG